MQKIRKQLLILQDILQDPDRERIFRESKERYDYNYGTPDELRVFVAQGMIRDMIKDIDSRSRKGRRVC